MIRLSQLSKQIGTDDTRDGVHPFVHAARFGQMAVDALRGTGEPVALAEALRAAAVPMVSGIHQEKLLREAVEVSRSCGDVSGEAWAWFQLGNVCRVPGASVEADRLFQQSGELRGRALQLQSRGVHESVHPEVRKAALMEALALFRESSSTRDEYRACVITTLFCRRELSVEECLDLLERRLELADGSRERHRALRHLGRQCREFGRRERAAECEVEAEGLVADVYGDREAYLKEELEACVSITGKAPRWGRASQRSSNIKARRLKAELRHNSIGVQAS